MAQFLKAVTPERTVKWRRFLTALEATRDSPSHILLCVYYEMHHQLAAERRMVQGHINLMKTASASGKVCM